MNKESWLRSVIMELEFRNIILKEYLNGFTERLKAGAGMFQARGWDFPFANILLKRMVKPYMCAVQ